MLEVRLAHLFTVKIDCDGPMHYMGTVPQGYGRRMVVPTGGRFEGTRLRGEVLPGGADSVIERADGGLLLDVRLALKTDRGDLVYMTYVGRRNGPPEIMQKILRREPIEPGTDYFRVAAQFETGSADLRWLNDIIAVGTGTREPNGPRYDIYEVL
ncbi:MAG: DUF3237 domain-containing protein [Burkholderiales bacterium]|nr:DUF3237 domain-containing protein [Burkholderiales bacterium]